MAGQTHRRSLAGRLAVELLRGLLVRWPLLLLLLWPPLRLPLLLLLPLLLPLLLLLLLLLRFLPSPQERHGLLSVVHHGRLGLVRQSTGGRAIAPNQHVNAQ